MAAITLGMLSITRTTILFLLLLIVLSTQTSSNEPESKNTEEEFEDDSEYDVELDSAENIEPAKDLVFDDRPIYKMPIPSGDGDVYFAEPFADTLALDSRWVQSKAVNSETGSQKYDGRWSIEEASQNGLSGDLALLLKDPATHHALSAELTKPFEFSGKPLIVQYEVKFQKGQDCGGAYIKLLMKPETGKLNLTELDDKTRYTIMFGPDRCGKDVKVHFIIQHRSPVTGKYEEKHAKRAVPSLLEDLFTDQKTHLFTLVLTPDNKYDVYLDQASLTSGSLLYDLTPPINPPREISDPKDTKPEDWDDREKIPDPTAKKPEDWDETEPEMIDDLDAVKPESWLEDEPLYLPDPNSVKPNDWSDEEDGEWEQAQIDNPACVQASGCGPWTRPIKKNPKYKGVWPVPMINNPDYDGVFTPRLIQNPDYFEDNEPYKLSPIVAVGLELWSVSDGMLFDNFIITDSKSVADQYADDGWRLKRAEEHRALTRTLYDILLDVTLGRAWLWPVMALMVIIPVVLFVFWCCCRTDPVPAGIQDELEDEPTMPDSDEGEMWGNQGVRGWLQYFWKAADKRRWLWGVYMVVILAPFIILSTIFCPKRGPLFKAEDIKELREKEYGKKKSPKKSPRSRGGDKSPSKPIKGKGSLETLPRGAEGKTVSFNDHVESHSDDADEDTEDDENTETSDTTSQGTSARRRRVTSMKDLD